MTGKRDADTPLSPADAADTLKCNQLVCFRMIEEHLDCLVKVVRIEPINSGTGNA